MFHVRVRDDVLNLRPYINDPYPIRIAVKIIYYGLTKGFTHMVVYSKWSLDVKVVGNLCRWKNKRLLDLLFFSLRLH